MLHYISCKGHREVITQSFLAKLGSQVACSTLREVFRLYTFEEVTRVENFEEQFIALLAIFAHKGLEVFHGGSLYLAKAVESINLTYGVEYIVALCHLNRREVARSFRYAWFVHCLMVVLNITCVYHGSRATAKRSYAFFLSVFFPSCLLIVTPIDTANPIMSRPIAV